MHSTLNINFILLQTFLLDYNNPHKYIGKGILLSQCEGQSVHGKLVTKTEEYIQINHLFEKNLIHPVYGYGIEIGSFVQWDVKSIERLD